MANLCLRYLTDAKAPAATVGGIDVVKIKPGAIERIASTILAEEEI